MKYRPGYLLVLFFLMWVPHNSWAAEGIAPERIYQQTIDVNTLIATWEVLPDENPLDERNATPENASHRTLMTLRKDGTCRVFNQDNPTGSDGLWTLEDHDVLVSLKNGKHMEFYVYGVKGDFMVARSPIKEGKDQLWSKVK
ncbi:MAG TPA: hypothetical protein VK463_04075 [Desulfomonilaceae bacterium]|nr:hypothetical protein [Desulfomonilaceae bacterium]